MIPVGECERCGAQLGQSAKPPTVWVDLETKRASCKGGGPHRPKPMATDDALRAALESWG